MASSTLTCFGVGDGWPSADRNHSSFLYRFEQGALLLDCGEPISRSFKASGLSYDLIDSVVLSHFHFDHVGGFFMLIQGFWLEGRTKPLVVRAPADGIPALRQTLRAGCIFDELLPFPLQFEPLQSEQRIQVNGTQFIAYPTTHLARLRELFEGKYAQDFAAYCFMIEAGPLRIGHSADIGAVTDLAPLVTQPLDFLVCELAHIEPEPLFAYLRGRAIKQILFIHLSRECRANQKAVQTLARDTLGSIPFSFADDGDEVELR